MSTVLSGDEPNGSYAVTNDTDFYPSRFDTGALQRADGAEALNRSSVSSDDSFVFSPSTSYRLKETKEARVAWAKSNSSLDDSFSSNDSSGLFENSFEEGTTGGRAGAMSEEAANYFTAAGKGRQREKREWLTKRSQLRQRAIALERDVRTRLFNTKIDEVRTTATRLHSEHDRISLKREKDCKGVVFRLNHIQQSTVRLKKQVGVLVANEAGGVEAQVRNLHATFDGLEAEFDQFKKVQRARYNELTNRENQLDKEIFEVQRRVGLWESADLHRQKLWEQTPKRSRLYPGSARKKNASRTPNTVGKIIEEDTRPPELVALERQVERDGGATGIDWTAKDHAIFLRLLSKYNLRTVVSWIVEKSEGDVNNMPNLSRGLRARLHDMIATAQEKLPLTSPSMVKEHWDWYCVHECRVERKKRLVREWRQSKRKGNAGSPRPDAFRGNNRAKANASTPSQGSPGTSHFKEIEEKRRAKERKALLEWKREKNRAAEENARAEQKAGREKVMKQRREREERMIMKEHVAMYKLQRESEKARAAAVQRIIKTAAGNGPRRAPSSKILMRNHARNMKRVAREKVLRGKKAKEKADKQARLDKLAQKVAPKAVHVDVTRETTAVLRRRRTQEELDDRERQRKEARAHGRSYHSATGAEHSRGKSYTFSSFGGTRTPSWCRGMNG